MIYLDNAATTAKKPFCVYRALMSGTIFGSGNAGRGGHMMSVKSTEAVIEAQDEIASLLNIDNPQNIAFTMNATYALNMVILGVLAGGGHAIASQMAHNSVLRPLHSIGQCCTIVSSGKDGYTSPEAFRNAIREDTKLIICTHASNVCGTIEPVEEICAAAHEKNILCLVDAAQTAGCLETDVQRIGADFIVFSGHKGLMGPLGTGGVYVKNPTSLKPVITGGTGSKSESLFQPRFMPDMMHSGTVNAPALKALAEGVRYIRRHGVAEIAQKEQYLAKKLEEKLLNMGGITVYGNEKRIGTTAFNIGSRPSGETAQLLSDKFALRAGYHCAPLAHNALGTKKIGAVRASFGIFNGERDAERLADAVWRLRKSGGKD